MINPLFELFKDDIDWPDVYEDAKWCYQLGEVHYNLEGNVEDLFNGDGKTYGGEVRFDAVEREGHILYTLDSSCGYDYQVILKLENQVEYD